MPPASTTAAIIAPTETASDARSHTPGLVRGMHVFSCSLQHKRGWPEQVRPSRPAANANCMGVPPVFFSAQDLPLGPAALVDEAWIFARPVGQGELQCLLPSI